MTFNVDDFRTYIGKQNEFSLSSRFQVDFAIPAFLRDSGFGDNLHMTCAMAELPGVDITPAEFRHYAFTQRIPWHVQFAPVTLTFLCTGKMIERKFFDLWMNKMIPFQTGLVEYPMSADGMDLVTTTNITIRQFGNIGEAKVNGNAGNSFRKSESGKRNSPNPNALTGEGLKGTYQTTLLDAMPLSMQSLQLDWTNENIHHLAVVFAYNKWTSDYTTEYSLDTPKGAVITDPMIKDSGATQTDTNNVSNK